MALPTCAISVAFAEFPNVIDAPTLYLLGKHVSEKRLTVLVETLTPELRREDFGNVERIAQAWVIVLERQSISDSFANPKCYGPVYTRNGSYSPLDLYWAIHGGLDEQNQRQTSNAVIGFQGQVWKYKTSRDRSTVTRFELTVSQTNGRWQKDLQYTRNATGLVRAGVLLHDLDVNSRYSESFKHIIILKDDKSTIFDIVHGRRVHRPWLQNALAVFENWRYSNCYCLYIKGDLSQMVGVPLIGITRVPGDVDGANGIGLRVPWLSHGVIWDSRVQQPSTFTIPSALRDPCPTTVRFLREGPYLLGKANEILCLSQCGVEREFTIRLPKDRHEGIWLQQSQSNDELPVICLFRTEYGGKPAYSNVDALRIFEWYYERKELRESVFALRELFKHDGNQLRPITVVKVDVEEGE